MTVIKQHLNGENNEQLLIMPDIHAGIYSNVHQFIINTMSYCPAKSDSDVMFCLQRYQGIIIDRSLVN